jgi:lysophospholipase L1-like esterase
MKRLAYLLALATCLVTTAFSYACPAVGRIPDFNCDGKAIIAVIGDSIVYGVGDTAHRNAGGYVLRAQEKFPEATFLNFGVPGLRTKEMIKDLKAAFADSSTSKLAQGLVSADVVIFDVGRNDRWLFGTPFTTYRNIKRARLIVEAGVVAQAGYSPLMVTAVMLLPNRGSQGPWMKALNALIEKGSSDFFPADLLFNQVSKRLLSADRIHPRPAGYTALAAVLTKYLLNNYPLHVAALRKDADQDGLYDLFEHIRYGTDPLKADTDGDGIQDGADPDPLNP